MNTKLLASIAVFALVTSLVTSSMTSAYAADTKVADKKAKMDMKMDAKKAKMDKKMDDKKAKMDNKMAKKDDKKAAGAASGASGDITVDMPKGGGANTECADKCYVPNVVTVKAGSSVTWKNSDGAAHTATATDGKSFDTKSIKAGGSGSVKFDTAGTYPYMCSFHPWMQGTVTVQ